MTLSIGVARKIHSEADQKVSILETQLANKEKELKNKEEKLTTLKIKNKLTSEQETIMELILKLQPRLDPKLAEKFSVPIVKYSKEYGFPSALITCLIDRESSFNPVAVSSANCVGLMQINPKAHAKLLEKKKINYYQTSHIDNNIEIGCIILKEYFEKHNRNIRKALTNYVGGDHKKYVNDILDNFAASQIKTTAVKKIKAKK